MSLKDWAKKEVEIACKRENPNWDGKSFDYGCSCYMSALKAFESLCDDGHSGYSFSATRRILEKLLYNRPLTPITDEDFNGTTSISSRHKEYQCPRMSSLFKTVYEDGSVEYSDVNRAYSFDAEFPDDTFTCGFDTDFLDKLIPITLPYDGTTTKYEIKVQRFDTKDGVEYRAILSIKDPDGKVIPVDKYYRLGDDDDPKHKMITKEEFELALQNRDHTIAEIVKDRILHILEYYEEDYSDGVYNDFMKRLNNDSSLSDKLLEACQVFEHCNPEYRTWTYLRRLVHKHKDFEDYDPIFDGLVKSIQELPRW